MALCSVTIELDIIIDIVLFQGTIEIFKVEGGSHNRGRLSFTGVQEMKSIAINVTQGYVSPSLGFWGCCFSPDLLILVDWA